MKLTVRLLGIVMMTALSRGCTDMHAPADHIATSSGPDQSLQMLMDGNQRFVGGHRQTHDEPRRRQELASSQKPIAVIVSCSDSRVPPEIVFDQNLGDIFVIRTAGQVVGDLELGSIEYAVEHLGTPLIFVLGHERCGGHGAAAVPGWPQ